MKRIVKSIALAVGPVVARRAMRAFKNRRATRRPPSSGGRGRNPA